MSAGSTANISSGENDGLREFVAVAFQSRTYTNLLYLVIAFPLGYIYFILFLIAFVFGVVFSLFLVGIPILFAALVGARYIGELERLLANALLDTDIKEPTPVQRDGPWDTAVAYVGDEFTWRALGFVALKFWLGLLSFVLVLVGIVTVLALVFSPVGESTIFGWSIDSTAEMVVAISLGFVLLFVFLHLCNIGASLSSRAATALLDNPTPVEDSNPSSQRQSARTPESGEPASRKEPGDQSDHTASSGESPHSARF